jgi:hypothetical protein
MAQGVGVPTQLVVAPRYVQPWYVQAVDVWIWLHGVSVPVQLPSPDDHEQP